MANRKCDRCGGRTSPWIPRKRSNAGDEMLCAGCKQAERHERLARVMKVGEIEPVPDRQPYGASTSDDTDFGWEDDLAPEGYHPLMAPLPNSVWERFAKSQELRGKPIVRPASQRVINARMAHGKATGKNASLTVTATEVLPHPEDNPDDIKAHIQLHHGGMADWEAEVLGHEGLKDHHEQLHHSTSYEAPNHEHPEAGAPGASSAPVSKPNAPLPESAADIKAHLAEHHGTHVESDDYGKLDQIHQHDHGYYDQDGDISHQHLVQKPESNDSLIHHLKKHHGYGSEQLAALPGALGEDSHKFNHALHGVHDHAHAEGTLNHHVHVDGHVPDEAGSTEQGPTSVPHPSNMTGGGLETHLLAHHGFTHDTIGNAADGSSKYVMKSDVLKGLHAQAHSQGFGTEGHFHEGYGKDGFTHPSPHTLEEHLGHLKEAHGFSDEQLEEAKKTGPFGGAAAKVKGIHDGLHAGLAPQDPGHEHTGHQDVGKPFVGNLNDGQLYAHSHLKGSHGLSSADMDKIEGSLPPGHSMYEKDEAYEKAHQALHAANSESFDHQHVPTTHPGVKPPEQVAKEAMTKHLTEDHKVTSVSNNPDFDHKHLHDPDGFGFPGHPGHDHPDPKNPTAMSQALPKVLDHKNQPTGHAFHHQHASDMQPSELDAHLVADHGNDLDVMDHSYAHKLQLHAQQHATGQNGWEESLPPHTHAISQSGTDALGNKMYGGHEPEPQTDTHPAPDSESAALAHIIQHHPNVSQDLYQKHKTASPTSMQDFHAKLHQPPSEQGGYSIPAAPDNHDHATPQGPPTGIPIGSHLVSHHGMKPEDVASMTPAEFKAHHEDLHFKNHEVDLGHGHMSPGGPVRAAQSYTPNTHHAEMRSDPDHPAVHEWYHGTSTEYEGPPKNATELQEGHGFWGNFGGGDWNNHAGTHWTSLHQMARQFNGGGNRVIHARLHMQNPIVYNSLNHMSHDAYDRLHASGDMEDDGEYLGHHDDDSGYNHCCSDALLEYAKGGRRSDGKYGMERYRDSLRASGHDGIIVRNQADSPKGHWNAVPLSADQIEITNASCHGTHGDERDTDKAEFERNAGKLNKGWQHPKRFDPMEYTGGKPLPDKDQVDGAGMQKKIRPEPPHVREGRAPKRGDEDPYTVGRDLMSNDHCAACDSDGDHYCDNCGKYVPHHQWEEHEENEPFCSVCEEYGHEPDGNHPYCDHCNDYTDHDSDDHEDEWGEHPDKIQPEGYCPHCEANTKQNYGKSECVDCGEKLPNWGKLVSHGTPVKPEDYKASGDTEGATYSDQKDAPLTGVKGWTSHALASHLYHHHMSDVSGKEFEDENGDWDSSKLEHHHAHLHSDPAWAKQQGFTMDHAHPEKFGQFKPHEAMTPEEVHAHLILAHGSNGYNSQPGTHPLMDLANLQPSEAPALHKQLHAADDAVPWGEKDSDGDLKDKLSHHHQLTGKEPTNAPQEGSPHGEELLTHIKSAHGLSHASVHALLKNHQGVAEAMHQQLHDSWGPTTEPTHFKYHTHTEQPGTTETDKATYLKHMETHHGIDATHHLHPQLVDADAGTLAKLHDQEHNSIFPYGDTPDHDHQGQNPYHTGWMKSTEGPGGPTTVHSSRRPTLTDYFLEVTA